MIRFGIRYVGEESGQLSEVLAMILTTYHRGSPTASSMGSSLVSHVPRVLLTDSDASPEPGHARNADPTRFGGSLSGML